jgi:uncharacterized protein YbjT (DUF2867 family)
MKLAVIGANGKVATLLCQRASKLFDTTAFIRNAEQVPKFEAMGIKTSLDIDISDTTVTSITKALKGYDAVVFSAGAGGKGLELTFSVDLDGAVKVAEAVKANGIHRFILVSAIKSQDREFWWNGGIRSYYIAKKYADEIIMNMGINYTIVQPGGLLDTPGLGKVMDPTKVDDFADTVNVLTERGKISIPRDDVALAIVECLKNDETIKKVIPLISGDVPVEEAVQLAS